MTNERGRLSEPAVQAALSELQSLIQGRYPAASFAVAPGEDPEGAYLTATVDVEDADEVVDLFLERMVDLQVEEGLPVYVTVLRPLERVVREVRNRHPRRSAEPLPL